jgi:hypothetical protein
MHDFAFLHHVAGCGIGLLISAASVHSTDVLSFTCGTECRFSLITASVLPCYYNY